MSILITGGAGFIGSNFIHYYLNHYNETVINVDKLNYAGSLDNLSEVENNKHYKFYHIDIANYEKFNDILNLHKPKSIIHFAAESHVDTSIRKPYEFVSNNILGTLSLLNSTLSYYEQLEPNLKNNFKLIHISTDEVFGSLELGEDSFTENSQYSPNSPYAASKAGADHLSRAWHKTFDLPIITSNCSNNYGPRQFPEKLIPVVISKALSGLKIPVYGDGLNIRDWLHVEDHCRAIDILLKSGTVGETYNIGGNHEMTNRDLVLMICSILDELIPLKNKLYSEQIEYVTDRRGHDRRYSINSEKIFQNTGWKPSVDFVDGIRETVEWYLQHSDWLFKSLDKIKPSLNDNKIQYQSISNY